MKIRVITPEGRVRFVEESVARNVQFMKKYGLKVQHMEPSPQTAEGKSKEPFPKIPEGNIITDKALPLLSDGFIPETIIQKPRAAKKPGPKKKPSRKK